MPEPRDYAGARGALLAELDGLRVEVDAGARVGLISTGRR